MDTAKIIHDLTITILQKSDCGNTSTEIVDAYGELLPKVTEAYNDKFPKQRTARVLNRKNLGI